MRQSKILICSMVVLLAMVLGVGGCSGGGSANSGFILGNVEIAEIGTIQITFEEGYAIEGDSGRKYMPTNLPAAFQRRGLRVRFRAKDKGPFQSYYHTVATSIEIIEIQELSPVSS